MNPLITYILYLYIFSLTSAGLRSPIRIETKSGFLEIIPKTESTKTNNTTFTTPLPIVKNIDEKEIKSLLLKMLTLASSANQINVPTTTEKTTTENSGVKTTIENKPEKYSGDNFTISEICPFFVSDRHNKLKKMEGIYWPRFYNMKEGLKCFKIQVKRINEKQMKENEMTYGTFGGRVNWWRTHFEITSPALKGEAKRRHFLQGDVGDMGVMRNIVIASHTWDEYHLQEESPDQWLMIRKLVILRDCVTGEVVVFTQYPQHTTTADVVNVLQELGEEMTGQMVCDEDDDWLNDYYV